MQTTWKHVDKDWYEKTFINDKGSPMITYHYRRKSAPPIPTVILQSKQADQLCGYHLIEKDIRDTVSLLEEHNKLFDTCENPGNNMLLKGLTRAIVITYGKCFTQADGRKIKLNKCLIKSRNNQDTHEFLMKMRHQYVAHAGSSVHEIIHLYLLCPPLKEIKKATLGKFVQGDIVLGKNLRQTSSSIEFSDGTVISLLNELQAYLHKKIDELTAKLNLQSINPQKLWNLVQNKKRFLLDEEAIQKIIDK